jgi:hypothetical protein
VSDVPVDFFEYARGIHLEYHQAHKPLPIAITLLIYVWHKVLLIPRGVYSRQQSFDSSHQPPLTVSVTQFMRYELVLQKSELGWLSRSGDMSSLKDHEQRLVP